LAGFHERRLFASIAALPVSIGAWAKEGKDEAQGGTD
jgi:hypothetical protein